MGEFLGMPPSGKHIEFRVVTLMTVEGNKIVHERRVYDFTGFLVKLGVLKARPA
jgi:predicted ester cyclase